MSGVALDPAILDRAEPPVPAIRRMGVASIVVGILAGALWIIGLVVEPIQALRSYLVAYVFWLLIALGALGILMISHVSPGAWSIMLRRPLEAASSTTWLLAALVVPIVAGRGLIYPWAPPDAAALSEAIAQKTFYLDGPFFIARAGLYFIVWGFLASALSRMSSAQRDGREEVLAARMSRVSAVGLVVYCLTLTFAAFDWVMSLEPSWSSTIFGMYVIGGAGVSGLAFAVVVAFLTARRPGPLALFGPRHFHDFGKMLLAFVMLWAYFAFSQFLIIWAGDLPEEITYYERRILGGLRWVSLALALLHFAVPFALLLPRANKRSPARLAAIAALLLVMRWVDAYWLVEPAFHPQRIVLHWLDAAAFLALGGVWLFLFFRRLATRPLVPVGEPLLGEALEHGT